MIGEMPALVDNLTVGAILVLVILFSLSVHEYAHALTASVFGDPTAKLDGRLTLNPLAHWDPIGTSLLVGLVILRQLGLPIAVFGWGKPVPVNENNFDNPRFHSFQTAIAGPMSNLLLAGVLAALARFASLPLVVEEVLRLAVFLNVFLMFFNLVPIPPLDGSKILRLFMSDNAFYSLSANPLWFFGLLLVLLFFFLDYLAMISQTLTIFLLAGS